MQNSNYDLWGLFKYANHVLTNDELSLFVMTLWGVWEGNMGPMIKRQVSIFKRLIYLGYLRYLGYPRYPGYPKHSGGTSGTP